MKIDIRQFAGPQAASEKYDVLTALSLVAFEQGGALQVSVLRLIGLITARYNWRLDELSVCQRDMARMWGVTERTAKREVRAWVDARLMIRKRVGVRGRAGAYRLDMISIRQRAQPLWSRVGPDYVERMTPPVAMPFSVPEIARTVESEVGQGTEMIRGTWRAVSDRLKLADAASHAAWIVSLRARLVEGGDLELTAPSRFAAHYIRTHLMRGLLEAAEAELGPGARVTVIAAAQAN